MITSVRILIRGQVQGVGFRRAAQRRALSLGLTGWVRNLGDGSVEVFATGPETPVNALLRWCSSGSERARVAAVEAVNEDPQPFGSFKIRYES